MKLAAVLACLSLVSFASSLEFHDDGTFKIVQFTDLHYKNDAVQDSQTTVLLDKLLVIEKPDLVVLSGDVVTGDAWDEHTDGWFENLWDRAVSPMSKHGIPYVAILGNHDVQAYLSPEAIIRYDTKKNRSLTKIIPGVPASNYYLDIGDELRIWLLDSGNDRCRGKKSWGCVEEAVLQWSRTQAPKKHALAFIHIPIPQMDPAHLLRVRGEKHEGISCAASDFGVLEFAAEQNVRGIFHGHDHGNDYVGFWKGIMLAYGRQTGYGGYVVDDTVKGARVISIQKNRSSTKIVTWIRTETGEKVYQSGFRDAYTRYVRKVIVLCVIFGAGLVAACLVTCKVWRKHVYTKLSTLE